MSIMQKGIFESGVAVITCSGPGRSIFYVWGGSIPRVTYVDHGIYNRDRVLVTFHSVSTYRRGRELPWTVPSTVMARARRGSWQLNVKAVHA